MSFGHGIHLHQQEGCCWFSCCLGGGEGRAWPRELPQPDLFAHRLHTGVGRSVNRVTGAFEVVVCVSFCVSGGCFLDQLTCGNWQGAPLFSFCYLAGIESVFSRNKS